MQALLPQEDRKNESDGDKTTSAPSASQIASSRSQIICDLTAGEIRESVAVVSSVRQRVCNDQVAESRAALSVGGSAAPWSARPACGYNPASKIAGPLYGHGRPPRPGDLGSGLYVCFVPVCLHGFAFQGDCAPGVSKILARGVFW